MGVIHNEKAAPAVAGNDPFKSDRLGGALRKQENTHRHCARQPIVRLNAKIGALAVWKEDIERRIATARDAIDTGCFFPLEIGFADAVRPWQLACAREVLDLDPQGFGNERRFQREVGAEEVRQIVENTIGFFDVLAEWSGARASAEASRANAADTSTNDKQVSSR